MPGAANLKPDSRNIYRIAKISLKKKKEGITEKYTMCSASMSR